jgi:hypothetical protein
MTNKDFDLIAAVLNAANHDATLELADIAVLAQRLADALKATNKQFNRDKFLHACGVSP